MKDVLQYLFDRLKDKQPVTVDAGGQLYAVQKDGTLGAPIRELEPQFTAPTLQVATLSALSDIWAAKTDERGARVGFHVADHLTVHLLALDADKFGRRHAYATAKHVPDTPFKFGAFYDSPEQFLIDFRASFLFNDEAVKVSQVCSQVGAGETVAVSDDGISQEVVVKSGTVTKSSVQLPADGIPLIPWRTFRDAGPVVSKFLLRMRGVKDGLPKIALIEIDAKWRIETQASIAHYLKAHCKDAVVIS